MQNFETSYYTLFTAICDAVENLDALLLGAGISDEAKKALQIQADNLRFAQQRAEESLIQ